MNKLLSMVKTELFENKIKKIIFILLIINLLLWPVFSYQTFLKMYIVSDLFEYAFLFFCVLHILIRWKQNLRLIALLLLFFVLLFIPSILNLSLNFGAITYIFRILSGVIIIYGSHLVCSDKKKLNLIFIVLIISVCFMFVLTILFNIKHLDDIIKSFNGGGYRLGTDLNQSNIYGIYCFYLNCCCIYFICRYKKISLVSLVAISSIISFGTQSKRSILINLISLLVAIIICVAFIRNPKIRFVSYASIALALIVTIVLLLTKTNIFYRLILSLFSNSFDASSYERINMFKNSFEQTWFYFLIGHGVNTFNISLFLNYGHLLIFHSTIGDLYFSSGIFLALIWIYFVFVLVAKGLFYTKGKIKYLFYGFLLIQLFLDLTSQVWYSQYSLFFLGALFPIKNQILIRKTGIVVVNI